MKVIEYSPFALENTMRLFFIIHFSLFFLNIKINEPFRTFSLFPYIVLTLSTYSNPQCDRHLNTCIKSIDLHNVGLRLITQTSKYFSSNGPCGSDWSINFGTLNLIRYSVAIGYLASKHRLTTAFNPCLKKLR